MSKASEWVRKSRPIFKSRPVFKCFDSKGEAASLAQLSADGGLDLLAATEINGKHAMEFARWIIDTFGDD